MLILRVGGLQLKLTRFCFLIILSSVFSCSFSVNAQTCPTTPPSKQARAALKNKKPADDISVSTISVSDILNWDVPSGVANPRVRQSKMPIDPHESKAFTLTGDLWSVELQLSDCDLHLELTKPGGEANDDRIVVEIPARDFATDARTAILDKRTEMTKAKLIKKNGTDFLKPVRVTLTGVGFFDATHWTKKKPKIGTDHGTKFVKTLWELHPVFKVEFPPT